MDLQRPVQQTWSEPPAPKRNILPWLLLPVALLVGAGIVALLWFYAPKPTAPASTQTAASNTTSQQSSSSSSSSAQAAAACTFNNLSMSVGLADGTAGTIYQHMVFKNKGTTSCTIAGYPAVFLLDATSTVLGSGAVPMTTFTPSVITLVPGAKAYTAVGFPEAANFPTGGCTANATTIRVYLPGSTSYLEAALAKPNCPGFSATAVVTGE